MMRMQSVCAIAASDLTSRRAFDVASLDRGSSLAHSGDRLGMRFAPAFDCGSADLPVSPTLPMRGRELVTSRHRPNTAHGPALCCARRWPSSALVRELGTGQVCAGALRDLSLSPSRDRPSRHGVCALRLWLDGRGVQPRRSSAALCARRPSSSACVGSDKRSRR